MSGNDQPTKRARHNESEDDDESCSIPEEYKYLSPKEMMKRMNEQDKVIKKQERVNKKQERVNKEQDMVNKEQDKVIKKQERGNKNRSMESLLEVGEGKFELSRDGVPFSHVNGGHQEANAKKVDFELRDPDQGKVRSCPFVSTLLLKFVDQEEIDLPDLKFKTKNYGSEADICNLVGCAVDDAIAILKWEGVFEVADELETRMERSLFGCRPDVMVVRNRDGIGFLAIEVKQPLPNKIRNKKSLADHPRVLGHAYDHAEAMDAFGQGTALVMITSFEDSILCSLNESDMKRQEENAGVYSTPSNHLQSQSQSQSPPLFKTPPAEQCAIARKVSKDDSSACSSSNSSPGGSPPVAVGEIVNTFIKEAGERLLYRSKSYPSHQLVKLVYSALRLAKDNYKNSSRTVSKLVDDKIYSFPKVLRVTDDVRHYFWGRLAPFKLGQAITSQTYHTNKRTSTQAPIDKHDSESYCIIGCLGRGATSNVYHALDGKGKQVALKVYVKNIDGNNKRMEQEDFEKEAKEATSKEVANLLEFYPSLKAEVRVVKIFNRQCVRMPLFEPVAKNERVGRLEDIRKVLKEFGAKNKKYGDEDVRWRHVGKYKEKCILYDLSDLVDSESNDFVMQHHKIFEERCKTDAEAMGSPLNVDDVSP
jgi:hypothetical protein